MNVPFKITLRIIVVTVLIQYLIPSSVFAQDLEYLPPVIITKPNNDTVSLVLATIDQAKFEGKKEAKSYTHSIQIIDADHPWPPRWYRATPVYTSEQFMKDRANRKIRIDFMENPQVYNGDFISYVQVIPLDKIDNNRPFDIQHTGSMRVLNKQMQLIDSIKSPLMYGGIYSRGFRNDKKIEQLMYKETDSCFDLRKITGNQKDSAVWAIFSALKVYTSREKLLFIWNPLAHLNLSLFHIKELADGRKSDRPDDEIRFLKFTSFKWDYDGNILFSLKKCTIGKISRKDGHLIWHFDTDEMLKKPTGGAFESYSPSDLNFLYQTENTVGYSFYERGYEGRTSARGVLFEQNKKTLEMKVVKYIYPKKKYIAGGQAGFDYDRATGNYLIDYGVFENEDTSSFFNVFEYGKNDSTYAVYQLPRANYCFGAHRLENWPLPPRPVIQKSGDKLIAKGNMKSWTWYKLEGPDNTTIKKIGAGESIVPEKGATYCVAGPYGVGFSVSKVYTYK